MTSAISSTIFKTLALHYFTTEMIQTSSPGLKPTITSTLTLPSQMVMSSLPSSVTWTPLPRMRRNISASTTMTSMVLLFALAHLEIFMQLFPLNHLISRKKMAKSTLT
jgi:hypothetical protein